jgi:AcrR family transcriptional regulator
MPRWDPQAEARLRTAAIELFLERGYENVTVAEIADRAGLTRRTFSRYFTDKRDVLFAGSEELPGLLAGALRAADPDLGPFEALVTAFAEVGEVLGPRVAPHAAQRRAVIAGSPELQERGRTKSAAVTEALVSVLRERGCSATEATLLAGVGSTIFQSGFDRWVDDPGGDDLPTRLREAGAELAQVVAGHARTTT